MKEQESRKSDRITLQLWMKFVLLIVLFFIVIILYSLVLANITDFQAKQNRTLPQVPFSTSKSFCPLSESVHNVAYEKGGLLILSKPEKYIVGDKILIQNRYADKKKYSINNDYVLGVISEVKEQEYIANLFSFEKQPLAIKDSEIEGKVDKYYPSIGGIYNNFIGIKGYVLFGAIPIMIFCLLYFVFRLICIDKLSQGLIYHQETISETGNKEEYFEQETEVEWVIPSKERIKEDEEQEMKSMLLKTEDLVQEEQEILTTKESDKTKKAKMKTEASIVKEQAKAEETTALTPNKLSYDRPLSADEIIAIYREQQQTQKNKPQKQLEKIARMYYDNDIENYD